MPLRFADATLGIVGLGRIGRALATLAVAVGLTVVAHDPYAASDAIPLLELDDLLARSDVVSLHAPGGGGALLGPRSSPA